MSLARAQEIIDTVQEDYPPSMYTVEGNRLLKKLLLNIVEGIITDRTVAPSGVFAQVSRMRMDMEAGGHPEIYDTEPRTFMVLCLNAAYNEIGLEIVDHDFFV